MRIDFIGEYQKILENIGEFWRISSMTEYRRVSQNIGEYHRILESIPEYLKSIDKIRARVQKQLPSRFNYIMSTVQHIQEIDKVTKYHISLYAK